MKIKRLIRKAQVQNRDRVQLGTEQGPQLQDGPMCISDDAESSSKLQKFCCNAHAMAKM